MISMISISIDTLIENRVVEKNRVEYKAGWDPEPIIHTICAFANDYSNVNGGYIVIGIEEKNGIPKMPPKGIPKEKIDSIQKELFQYCNLIEPRYIPKIEVVDYHDKGIYLIYLKCSPGDAGPYQAPKDVYSGKGKKIKPDRTMFYWIRPSSVTTVAKNEEVAELFDKFNSVPFDDRVNRKATMECIRRGYVEDYLRKSGSSLYKQMNQMTMEEILLSLEVANETDDGVELRNIAVLMFADHPEKFIPGAETELVWFHDKLEEGSNEFTEKIFRGPIWKQVEDVLDYINTNIITEKVVKIEGQAAAKRFFNFPYNALEEIIVNAVFHKSYRDDVPVNVRIYLDRIEVINYPGPDQWIKMDAFAAGKIRPRKYRNRRIGEMFKEIDLSEKQGTGITKVINAMEQNGSAAVEFDTVDERVYLTAIVRKHEGFDNIGQENGNENVIDNVIDNVIEKIKAFYPGYTEKKLFKAKEILIYISENPETSMKELSKKMDTTERTIARYIKDLKELKIIYRDGPDNGGKWIIST